jgi:hypothetical protein
LHYFYTYIFYFVLYFSCLNGCIGLQLCSRLWAWNGLPLIHIFQCLLERTAAIMNEVLKSITFVLAYPTVLAMIHLVCVCVCVPLLESISVCTCVYKYNRQLSCSSYLNLMMESETVSRTLENNASCTECLRIIFCVQLPPELHSVCSECFLTEKSV